jgi:hypothetical protein
MDYSGVECDNGTMTIQRATLVAAVLGAFAISVGVAGTATAATTTFVARDDGTGATLSEATFAARRQLLADYGPCSNIVLVSDHQLSNGTWWAQVAGNCEYFN